MARIPDDDPKAPSPALGSRASRAGDLAKFSANTGVGMVAARLRQMAGNDDAADAFHGRTAQQAAELLGSMKGLAMKMGQIASFVDVDLPEEVRDTYRDQLAALKPWLDARKAEGLSRDVGGAVDDFPYAANIRDALDRIEVAAAKPKGWFK